MSIEDSAGPVVSGIRWARWATGIAFLAVAVLVGYSLPFWQLFVIVMASYVGSAAIYEAVYDVSPRKREDPS